MNHIKLFENFSNKPLADLESKLVKYSIPIQHWGTGQAKTTTHLLDELDNDECIIKDEGGYLVRYVEFVGIRILYKDENGVTWLLKEDRQEFKDGRVRRRDIQSSVSEKMKAGENPNISAVRGIEEELGIEVGISQLKKLRPLYYDGGSQSYPGLKSKYVGHHFTCYLTPEQFMENGYVEIQKDKSTFFKWVERDN
jgi:hypothetical protein